MVIMTMQSARESPPLLLGPATGRFCSWPVDWAIPLYRVGTQMADGVEVRGNRVRVYFRYEGELCREPFPGEATPDNIAQAERLVGMINYEIKAGTFSYARHFPDSPRVKTNTLGHYIDLWLDIKRNELAPSGFRAYKSKTENHIRPAGASTSPTRSTTSTCRPGCRKPSCRSCTTRRCARS